MDKILAGKEIIQKINLKQSGNISVKLIKITEKYELSV
jgi:hypothetical protein